MSGALIGLAALVALVVWLARRMVGREGIRRADADAVDLEELEAAEREVRDLDVGARPEDGFEGDDWGPGAGRPPVRR
jgi:hypothetical protein